MEDNTISNNNNSNADQEPMRDDLEKERRKGMDRRWIKSNPSDKERRTPDERREERKKNDEDFDSSRF